MQRWIKQATAWSLLMAAAWTAHADAAGVAAWKGVNPMVRIKTSEGDITVELYGDQAPATVRNFLAYVDSGFFAGTIFHRVIPGFMIQGGGFTADMQRKPTREPVSNEAGNGLRNERGTLAMARTTEVDSATSQFFINVKDNAFLDHRDRTPAGFGYCVFGKVVEGMDVVDRIERTPTGNRGPHQNVPLDPVLIIEAQRIVEEGGPDPSPDP